MIRRTKKGGHFFAMRNSGEKLIINLADNDHGWRDIIIRIYMAWEMALQKDCGAILTAWNKGTFMHKEILVIVEIEERVWSLLRIGIDYHNWSWLLDPSRLSTLPIVSCT